MTGRYIQLALFAAVLLLGMGTLWNLHKRKERLQISELKSGIAYFLKKNVGYVVFLSFLFADIYCGASYFMNKDSAGLQVKFNYEEAAKGLNPNKTRFNVSNLLAVDILQKVIDRGTLSVTPQELAECLELSSSFDEREITATSSWNIATDYRVSCTPKIAEYGINASVLMNHLADVYCEEFFANYSENDSILELDFSDMEGRDYLDTERVLSTKASKLKDYISNYSLESPSYRLLDNGESFSSLSEKIGNFIDVELERYKSYVLENGLSRDSGAYATRMGYQNRLLQSDYEKRMAAYDVRLETIDLYDEQMARIVLVPTTDEEEEYYMSRTKIGADYFADEAETALATATNIQEEMNNNDYAKSQVENSKAGTEVYETADQMIVDLRQDLTRLSEQAKELSDSYIASKRDGYLNTSVVEPSVMDKLDIKKGFLYTVFFAGVFSAYLITRYLRNGRSIR